MLSPTDQQFFQQFQSLELSQHQPQYYPGSNIPPLPVNVAMPMTQTYYTDLQQQQQGAIYAGYPQTNLQYNLHPSTVPLTTINPQQTSTGNMRVIFNYCPFSH
jgi:hypothetical protein